MLRCLQVYFHRFELSPIRLNITYLHSQKLVADLIRNPASTLLPNLDRAPIVLDAMVLQDTVTTAEELQSAIKLSYKSALLRQFYKLLLRVDMLSVPVRHAHAREWRSTPLTTHHSPLTSFYSPLTTYDLRQVRLVSGVGQGVKDFGAALLDVKGLLKSPEDFGRNLATGSLSLTRSVPAGNL